jgi:hypothetical protein
VALPVETGLVTHLVRRSLPVALLAATAVAALGLGGIVLSPPVQPPPAPTVALNLSSAPALPVADDGTAFLPQDLSGSPACAVPPPACPPPENASPSGSGGADDAVLPVTPCCR